MKKLSLLFFLIPLFGSLSLSAQTERITNFHTEIEVKKDRSVQVTEHISVYVAGDIIKRGITRSLPTSRKIKGRITNTKYQDIEVLRDGKTENFNKESTGNGIILYVGNKDIFLNPGYYDYTIKYKVPYQVETFDEFDEIYWNAIGTDVVFEIEKASCDVILPAGAEVLQNAAYLGKYGQNEQDFNLSIENGIYKYTVLRKMEPYEGFTVAVGFEKGLVEEIKQSQKFGNYIVLFLGAILLLPYYIINWMKHGQDPPTPPSYPIFESPEDYSPASLQYLQKERYTQRGFSSSIIQLAVKGYLKISELEGRKLFGKKKYDLIRIRSTDNKLHEEEEILMDALFSSGDVVTIDGKYSSHIEQVYKRHKANIIRQHRSFLRTGNNAKFLTVPILLTLAVVVISIIVFTKSPYATSGALYSIIGFAILGIIALFVFGYLIQKPTEAKLDLQSRIKGFKMYLELAEKERLNLLNPPDMTLKHFEAMLPFAFALGIEHKWTGKFKSLLESAQYQPEWHNSRNSYLFYNNFNSGFSRNLSGSSTPPSSSGGGSGGGGFSGGGGGGGGVGGW